MPIPLITYNYLICMKSIKIRRFCKGRGGSLEYSTHASFLKTILKGSCSPMLKTLSKPLV